MKMSATITSADVNMAEPSTSEVNTGPARKKLRSSATVQSEALIELAASDWANTLAYHLQQLREQSLFCDVVIQTSDSATYSAHASVLAAASPELSTYMQTTGLFVKFDEINGDTWQLLLAYMYTGKVQVLPSEVHVLYEAARRLGITSLTTIIDSRPDRKPDMHHFPAAVQGPQIDSDNEDHDAIGDEDTDEYVPDKDIEPRSTVGGPTKKQRRSAARAGNKDQFLRQVCLVESSSSAKEQESDHVEENGTQNDSVQEGDVGVVISPLSAFGPLSLAVKKKKGRPKKGRKVTKGKIVEQETENECGKDVLSESVVNVNPDPTTQESPETETLPNGTGLLTETEASDFVQSGSSEVKSNSSIPLKHLSVDLYDVTKVMDIVNSSHIMECNSDKTGREENHSEDMDNNVGDEKMTEHGVSSESLATVESVEEVSECSKSQAAPVIDQHPKRVKSPRRGRVKTSADVGTDQMNSASEGTAQTEKTNVALETSVRGNIDAPTDANGKDDLQKETYESDRKDTSSSEVQIDEILDKTGSSKRGKWRKGRKALQKTVEEEEHHECTVVDSGNHEESTLSIQDSINSGVVNDEKQAAIGDIEEKNTPNKESKVDDVPSEITPNSRSPGKRGRKGKRKSTVSAKAQAIKEFSDTETERVKDSGKDEVAGQLHLEGSKMAPENSETVQVSGTPNKGADSDGTEIENEQSVEASSEEAHDSKGNKGRKLEKRRSKGKRKSQDVVDEMLDVSERSRESEGRKEPSVEDVSPKSTGVTAGDQHDQNGKDDNEVAGKSKDAQPSAKISTGDLEIDAATTRKTSSPKRGKSKSGRRKSQRVTVELEEEPTKVEGSKPEADANILASSTDEIEVRDSEPKGKDSGNVDRTGDVDLVEETSTKKQKLHKKEVPDASDDHASTSTVPNWHCAKSTVHTEISLDLSETKNNDIATIISKSSPTSPPMSADCCVVVVDCMKGKGEIDASIKLTSGPEGAGDKERAQILPKETEKDTSVEEDTSVAEQVPVDKDASKAEENNDEIIDEVKDKDSKPIMKETSDDDSMQTPLKGKRERGSNRKASKSPRGRRLEEVRNEADDILLKYKVPADNLESSFSEDPSSQEKTCVKETEAVSEEKSKESESIKASAKTVSPKGRVSRRKVGTEKKVESEEAQMFPEKSVESTKDDGSSKDEQNEIDPLINDNVHEKEESDSKDLTRSRGSKKTSRGRSSTRRQDTNVTADKISPTKAVRLIDGSPATEKQHKETESNDAAIQKEKSPQKYHVPAGTGQTKGSPRKASKSPRGRRRSPRGENTNEVVEEVDQAEGTTEPVATSKGTVEESNTNDISKTPDKVGRKHFAKRSKRRRIDVDENVMVLVEDTSSSSEKPLEKSNIPKEPDQISANTSLDSTSQNSADSSLLTEVEFDHESEDEESQIDLTRILSLIDTDEKDPQKGRGGRKRKGAKSKTHSIPIPTSTSKQQPYDYGLGSSVTTSPAFKAMESIRMEAAAVEKSKVEEQIKSQPVVKVVSPLHAKCMKTELRIHLTDCRKTNNPQKSSSSSKMNEEHTEVIETISSSEEMSSPKSAPKSGKGKTTPKKGKRKSGKDLESSDRSEIIISLGNDSGTTWLEDDDSTKKSDKTGLQNIDDSSEDTCRSRKKLDFTHKSTADDETPQVVSPDVDHISPHASNVESSAPKETPKSPKGKRGKGRGKKGRIVKTGTDIVENSEHRDGNQEGEAYQHIDIGPQIENLEQSSPAHDEMSATSPDVRKGRGRHKVATMESHKVTDDAIDLSTGLKQSETTADLMLVKDASSVEEDADKKAATLNVGKQKGQRGKGKRGSATSKSDENLQIVVTHAASNVDTIQSENVQEPTQAKDVDKKITEQAKQGNGDGGEDESSFETSSSIQTRPTPKKRKGRSPGRKSPARKKVSEELIDPDQSIVEQTDATVTNTSVEVAEEPQLESSNEAKTAEDSVEVTMQQKDKDMDEKVSATTKLDDKEQDSLEASSPSIETTPLSKKRKGRSRSRKSTGRKKVAGESIDPDQAIVEQNVPTATDTAAEKSDEPVEENSGMDQIDECVISAETKESGETNVSDQVSDQKSSPRTSSPRGRKGKKGKGRRVSSSRGKGNDVQNEDLTTPVGSDLCIESSENIHQSISTLCSSDAANENEAEKDVSKGTLMSDGETSPSQSGQETTQAIENISEIETKSAEKTEGLLVLEDGVSKTDCRVGSSGHSPQSKFPKKGRKLKGKGRKSQPLPKAQADETSEEPVNVEEPSEAPANKHSQNEERLVESTTEEPQSSGMSEKEVAKECVEIEATPPDNRNRKGRRKGKVKKGKEVESVKVTKDNERISSETPQTDDQAEEGNLLNTDQGSQNEFSLLVTTSNDDLNEVSEHDKQQGKDLEHEMEISIVTETKDQEETPVKRGRKRGNKRNSRGKKVAHKEVVGDSSTTGREDDAVVLSEKGKTAAEPVSKPRKVSAPIETKDTEDTESPFETSIDYDNVSPTTYDKMANGVQDQSNGISEMVISDISDEEADLPVVKKKAKAGKKKRKPDFADLDDSSDEDLPIYTFLQDSTPTKSKDGKDGTKVSAAIAQSFNTLKEIKPKSSKKRDLNTLISDLTDSRQSSIDRKINVEASSSSSSIPPKIANGNEGLRVTLKGDQLDQVALERLVKPTRVIVRDCQKESKKTVSDTNSGGMSTEDDPIELSSSQGSSASSNEGLSSSPTKTLPLSTTSDDSGSVNKRKRAKPRKIRVGADRGDPGEVLTIHGSSVGGKGDETLPVL